VGQWVSVAVQRMVDEESVFSFLIGLMGSTTSKLLMEM
jgi:hypothetical protein